MIPSPTPEAPPDDQDSEGGPRIYVSSTSDGLIQGIPFAEEDVLAFDIEQGAWSLFFDGSVFGLDVNSAGVDAFTRLEDGSLLISLTRATVLPNLGEVDDSDILRLIPGGGEGIAAGQWELYFDGSDVGLTANGEDVDAVTMGADGALYLSFLGRFDVDGLIARDEDIVRFIPETLGPDTTGVWRAFFNGTMVGLGPSRSEDVWGAHISGDEIYLTSRSKFNVLGLSGQTADVFACSLANVAGPNDCAFSLIWDGDAHGFSREIIDALYVDPAGRSFEKLVIDPAINQAPEMEEEPEEPVDDEDDGAETVEVSNIYLPLVQR